MNSFLAAISSKQKEKEQTKQLNITDELTKEEIQLLVETMKNSTFRGEYVELFYSTVIKLQNQYIKLQQKE
jgi:hypothetical protein